MKKSEDYFSSEERARIEAAVQEAEMRTSGEIVPMVVDASYDYPRAEIVGAGFFALATGVLTSWAFGGESVWIFLAVFLLAYLPCKLLIRKVPALKRAMIPASEFDEEVREKALVSFLEQGLHHTRDRTGILLLISLFEHRVFVLADSGINDRVPEGAWDELVATITAGLKEGNACEALCGAITRCAELLERDFPLKEGDRDELPNLIMESD